MQIQPSSSNKLPQESSKEDQIVTPNPKEQQDPNPNGKQPATISDEPQTSKQPNSKEIRNQNTDQLEPREITQYQMGAENPGSPKEANEDPLLLDSDPGEETNEGASSSGLQSIPMKIPRGRKSKKK